MSIRKLMKRSIAGIIALVVMSSSSMSTWAYTLQAEDNVTINTENGLITADESWIEEFPTGTFAFKDNYLNVMESDEAVHKITVYRLGGTEGSAKAFIAMTPTVADDGVNVYYENAASVDDFTLQAEKPISECLETKLVDEVVTLEMELPMDNADMEVNPPEGYGSIKVEIPEELVETSNSALNEALEESAENALAEAEKRATYQWYRFDSTTEEWTAIDRANEQIILVTHEEEFSENYNFACVVTLDGKMYASKPLWEMYFDDYSTTSMTCVVGQTELVEESTKYADVEVNYDAPYETVFIELDFDEGEWIKDILVTTSDDMLHEANEFALFTIYDSEGATLYDSANRFTLGIEDDEAAISSVFGFEVAEIKADKAGGKAVVTVKRTAGKQYVGEVSYKTVDGTAVAGVDYAETTGKLAFNCGVESMTIEVPLINDKVLCEEANKSFSIELYDALAGSIAEGKNLMTVKLYNSLQDFGSENTATRLTSTDAIDLSEAVNVSEKEIIATDNEMDIEHVEEEYELIEAEVDFSKARTYDYGEMSISFSGTTWSEETYLEQLFNINTQQRETKTYTIDKMYERYSKITLTIFGEVERGYKAAQGWSYARAGAYLTNSKNSNREELFWINRADSDDNIKSQKGIIINIDDRIKSINDYANKKNNNVIRGEITRDDDQTNDVTAKLSIYMDTTRKALDNNPVLMIHTADDELMKKSSDGMDYIKNYLKPTVSALGGGTGGTNKDGKLFIGSQLVIKPNTKSNVYKLYSTELQKSVFLQDLTDSSRPIVNYAKVDNNTATIEIGEGSANSAVTYKGRVEKDHKYSINLILERTQNIVFDVSPSTDLNQDGTVSNDEINEAKNTVKNLLANAKYTGQKVDYSQSDMFSQVTGNLGLSDGGGTQITASNLKNIQKINFGLPNADRIIFNGISYAGDEDIVLDDLDLLQNSTLSFIYYAAEFVDAETTMKVVAFDRIEQYIDMNDNGVVDDSDILMATLVDESYEESEFVPVAAYDEATNTMKTHQQILRIRYTSIPKCLGIPEGATENDKAHIVPSFVTSITDEIEKAKLSSEMQGYRDIDDSDTGWQFMYGVKGTLGTMDIPLGGDFNPPEYVVTGTKTNKTGTDEYEVGEYRWNPDFRGNLRKNFENPETITVDGTVMADGFVVADKKDAINNYLGSFSGYDTIALNVRLIEDSQEVSESVTLAPFKSHRGMGAIALDQDKSATMSAPEDKGGKTDDAPNVTKAEPNFNLPTAELPIGPVSLIMDGYSVGFSIGIPLFSASASQQTTINTSPISPSQNKTSKGDWSRPEYGNPVSKSSEAISKAREAISSSGGSIRDEFDKIKNGRTTGTYNTNNVRPKANKAASFDVAVNMTFMWKYSKVDSQFHFDSAMFFIGASGSIKQTVRLSVCPIVYVYVIFGVEMKVGVGVNVKESVDAEGNRLQEVQFSGMTLSPTLYIEAGAGIGVEIAKIEVYLKVSVGFTASFGKNMGGASFDKFEFMAGFGVRAVFLFFEFKMDAIQIKMGYDKELIEKGEKGEDGWYFKWFAFGKEQKGRAIEGDYEELNSMPVTVTLPSNTYYDENVYAPEDNLDNPLSRAFDIEGMPFQISGYSSSASASKLADGLSTGSAYELLTVGNTNYIIYEKSVNAKSSGVDANQLVISKIKEYGSGGTETLGLVHPFNENSSEAYLKIDNDYTGDLDFNAYVDSEGNINVIWVSYEYETSDNELNGLDSTDALLNTSKKTLVKTAVINMSDEVVRNVRTVSGTPSGVDMNTNYKFLPEILGEDVIFFVESAQYSDEEKEAVNKEYKDYYESDTNEVLTDAETGQIYGTGDPYAGFQYQYAQNMNNLYGKYSTMNFSVKQANGNYRIVNIDPTESWKNNNTIIDSIASKEIDGKYYLVYTASEKALLTGVDDNEDVETIKRLYIQQISAVEDGSTKTVQLSDPVIIANLVDSENDENKDGVYVNGALKTQFTDPFFADLEFIYAKLDGKNAEDALIYNMNNNFYCIDSESLERIFTRSQVNVSPLFTIDSENGDTKSNVSIGTDGDGNMSAVYTDTMGNTTNNALFVIKYDSEAKVWGEGRMLAMNHMQVYEDAIKYGWTEAQMKEAFYNTNEDFNANGKVDEDENLYDDGKITEVSGGMDQFIFSSTEIAVGDKTDGLQEGTLLVITEGIYTELVENTYNIDGATVTQIEPDSSKQSELGFYAISYGIGEQVIGDANLSFLENNFVPAARLQPVITFTNQGDVAIRGSKDNPISVDMWITAAEGSGEADRKLASWKINNSIAPGAVVNTSTAELDDNGALPYADALPETVNGRTIYFTVSEDAEYVDNAYTYSSNIGTVANGTGKHVIENSYVELGFENVSVGAEGHTTVNRMIRSADKHIDVELNMDIYNKGTKAANNVKVKIEYSTGEKDEDGNSVYKPIEQTGLFLAGEEISLSSGNARAAEQGVFTLVDNNGAAVSIKPGYMRNVSGTVTLPSYYYDLTSATKSMNLRFTIISDDKEYADDNNIVHTSLEATSMFDVPDKINMVMGSRILVPVNVDTTRVGDPNISVYELVTNDSERVLNNIYYNAVTNVIIANAKSLGSGVIRIADTSTGSFTDMAFEVSEDGVNILNDNPSLLFKNNSEDGWEFKEGQIAVAGPAYYNSDIAIGHKGDSLEFETNASAIEFYFTGKARITSKNTFGFTSKVIESDDYSKPVTVMFGNAKLEKHQVMVEIQSEDGWFDKYVELYGVGIKLPTDENAPLIILGKSKPETGTLQEGTMFNVPVYIIDENALSSVSANNEEVEWRDTNFAYVEMKISQNGTYYITATDEFGNRRTEVLVVDWFGNITTETFWQSVMLTVSDKENNNVTGKTNKPLYLRLYIPYSVESKVKISSINMDMPDSYNIIEEYTTETAMSFEKYTEKALTENGFYIAEHENEYGTIIRTVVKVNQIIESNLNARLIKQTEAGENYLFYSVGNLDNESEIKRIIIYRVDDPENTVYEMLPEEGIEIEALAAGKILDRQFTYSTDTFVYGTQSFFEGSTFVLTCEDKLGNRDIAVAYGIPVTSVSLDKTEISGYKNETTQLTVTVLPENAMNKKVLWYSSDERIATVDETGLVTLMGLGEATITAVTVDGEYEATVKVQVNPRTMELKLNAGRGGRVEGAGSFDEESTVTVKAIPTYGVRFNGWMKGDELVSDKAEYSFAIMENTEITADFTAWLGDINEDGIIDAQDALMILKIAAKLESATERNVEMGDVTLDKTLDAADALQVLKYAAVIIDNFYEE